MEKVCFAARVLYGSDHWPMHIESIFRDEVGQVGVLWFPSISTGLSSGA